MTATRVDPRDLTATSRTAAALTRLLAEGISTPDVSIVIPVNARSDLECVMNPLGNIAAYTGRYRIEVILVINNYPPDDPPDAAIDSFRRMGIRVIAVPSARRPGEVVIVSARALGAREARAPITVHFDADCRIRDATALIDAYVHRMRRGAHVAYSRVGHYEVRRKLGVYVKLGLHHSIRWVKRNIFRIPTTRGSNYAVDRALFLRLYDEGRLSVDMQLGPAARLAGAKVAYLGGRRLSVDTSARRFQGRWGRMIPYLVQRLRYNLHAIPTRRRPVTRTSWGGFDRECENRAAMLIAADPDAGRDRAG
ncbi:MAG TPA: glycosyltransferase [Vicinamibacterales bacterium]|nr:glycosyltransferase [Vicinamibacterales bacterium]